MDDLDVHAGSSDEDMVHNVKTRATRKKVLSTRLKYVFDCCNYTRDEESMTL